MTTLAELFDVALILFFFFLFILFCFVVFCELLYYYKQQMIIIYKQLQIQVTIQRESIGFTAVLVIIFSCRIISKERGRRNKRGREEEYTEREYFGLHKMCKLAILHKPNDVCQFIFFRNLITQFMTFWTRKHAGRTFPKTSICNCSAPTTWVSCFFCHYLLCSTLMGAAVLRSKKAPTDLKFYKTSEQ